MSTPAGDVWIIGEVDEVEAIAEWFDRTVEEPRYVRHVGGHAIAVAFSCEADEVLFDLTFPQFRRARYGDGVVDICDPRT